MKLLVYSLIIFFILLLFYQLYALVFERNLMEGLVTNDDLTYQPYDTNNPNNALILGQQNAGNIEYLKQRVSKLESMQKEVNDISLNLISANQQIQGLVQQQQAAATQLVGDKPMQVSGTS